MAQLIISFVSSNDCFINLPLVFSNFFYEQNQSYLGRNLKVHENLMSADPQFGTAIGLHDGQKVSMKICENCPEANSVHVEPFNIEDWEIMDRRANYLEDYIVQQLRVVYINQIVTLWINSNLTRLRIVEINPKTQFQFAKLCANSEVFVKPKPRPTEIKSSENKDISASNALKTPIYCLRVLPKEYIGIFPSSPIELYSVYVHPKDFVNIRLSDNRVVRLSKVQPQQLLHNNKEIPHNKEGEDKSDIDNKSYSQNIIYVKVVENFDVVPGHVVLCESIRDCLDVTNFDIIRLAPSQTNPVALSNIIIRNISPFQVNSLKPNHSGSLPADKSAFSNVLINSFKAFFDTLSENSEVVFTNGMKLPLPSINGNLNITIFLGVKTVNNQNDGRHGKFDFPEMFTILTKKKLQNTKIEVGDNIPIPPDNRPLKQSIQDHLPKLAGVSNLIQQLEGYLRSCLGKVPLRNALRVPGMGGLLLCGGHGSGKTSIAKTITYNLGRDLQTLAYCLVVRCTELTEERISSVRDKLQQLFDDAAWHAPSIIFFDDLDRLIPAEVEHIDSFRFRQLSECFFHIATKMCERHRITIFATAQQQSSIHSFLITSHLFSEIAQLDPPTKAERREILEAIMASGPILAQNSISHLDLLSVASECEGYFAADLKVLVERTIHEGAARQLNNESQLLLTREDFHKAQEGFVPFSLRGVKLHTSEVSWTDIGGLEETKKVLLETLEWPTKYASIFANCPLRLRSGLLLYGFPGCGKTLLASAVAKECGLNFISVKGPELLNKYIGASEKSVRDLFERAQAAKPCVLFFDEFDSIAPKRGHDSTGVTDRVVNQMLTQMDGAEGLDGVYVLAATSRPDLIDPALLRPGRLDKSLLCNIPTFQERIEILKALSRKMELNEDIDLSYYAEKCEGYSGADLQALLYNAHLKAIHEAIDTEKSLEKYKSNSDGNDMQFISLNAKSANTVTLLTAAEKGQISQRLALIKKGLVTKKTITVEKEGEDDIKKKRTAIITNEHMRASLEITRPSTTPEERARLSNIYEEFITGRNGEMPSAADLKSHQNMNQRTTAIKIKASIGSNSFDSINKSSLRERKQFE
ncbi:AAA-domain-containing protein [Rhizophagus irregularis DAOM 181602=DAOM 197198]|nr:AAA-domain-containing protein [Rhizophagus irregularis DAOM 181602=DAOM 197198]